MFISSDFDMAKTAELQYLKPKAVHDLSLLAAFISMDTSTLKNNRNEHSTITATQMARTDAVK